MKTVTNNQEQWKPVDGWNGYSVSNQGRVKGKQGQLLKQTVSARGYKRVCLCNDQIVKTVLVHRLVAQAFIHNDDPENRWQVNHKNALKTDNRVENLEWVTPKENSAHMRKSGLYRPSPYLSDELKETIRQEYEDGMSEQAIAEKYKTSMQTVSKYVRDTKRYKAKKLERQRVLQEIEEMRKLYREGMTIKEISELYDCKFYCVASRVRGARKT